VCQRFAEAARRDRGTHRVRVRPPSAACPAPPLRWSQTFAGGVSDLRWQVSDLRWQGLRFEREAGGLVGDDLILLGQGEADVVVAFEQAPARVVVDLEGHGDR